MLSEFKNYTEVEIFQLVTRCAGKVPELGIMHERWHREHHDDLKKLMDESPLAPARKERERQALAARIASFPEGTTIRWVYDDGGRAAAGFRGSEYDSLVRAIAILNRCSYRGIYDFVKEEMKKGGHAETVRLHKNWLPLVLDHPYLRDFITSNRYHLDNDLCRAQTSVLTVYGIHKKVHSEMPAPLTFTEAYRRFGDCIVLSDGYMSAIVNGALRDKFDCRFDEIGERKALEVFARLHWSLPAHTIGDLLAERDPAHAHALRCCKRIARELELWIPGNDLSHIDCPPPM